MDFMTMPQFLDIYLEGPKMRIADGGGEVARQALYNVLKVMSEKNHKFPSFSMVALLIGGSSAQAQPISRGTSKLSRGNDKPLPIALINASFLTHISKKRLTSLCESASRRAADSLGVKNLVAIFMTG